MVNSNLKALIERFEIPEHSWDAIIVGDGSATTWKKQLGWGSILIQRGQIFAIPFYGGMSHGTNNMAELMSVLHPLMYLCNAVEPTSGGCKVHVITDSQYVANGLAVDSLLMSPLLQTNRELWLAVFATVRKGMQITPHHMLRDTIDLNKVCHDLANIARKKQIDLTDDLKWDVQDVALGG